MKYFIPPIALVLFFSFPLKAQNLAEKLGFEADAKMLIIHADDLGVAHSKNAASVKAMEFGTVNSASIMVPTPWFLEIVKYAKEHPEMDWGLHLTLTSEWEYYKWDGISSSNEIPGLLDDLGYFYPQVRQVVKSASPEEVEKEIRAQVDLAIKAGLQPTHLDTHMGTLIATPEYFEAYLKVGKEYGIPVLTVKSAMPEIREKIWPELISFDDLIIASESTNPEDWAKAYDEKLANLKPGITMFLLHLGYQDAEMTAMTVEHPHYEATWRQRDFDYVMTEDFKKLLKKYDIKLVTYRQIQQLMNAD